MKNAIFLIVTILCLNVQFGFSQTAEEKALIDVVTLETQSFGKRDSVTWKSIIVHDEKISFGYTMNGYSTNMIGWKDISKAMLNSMAVMKTPSVYTGLNNKNYVIRATDKMASMMYDQERYAPGIDSLPRYSTREFRTLFKEDDKWKIASMLTIDTLSFASTKPDIIESVFNAVGYNFIREEKWEQAIAIFKFNVSMYPKAWNTYDSLGEAYAKSGNKSLAILNYRKSLALDPKNDNAIKILKDLEKK